MIRPSPKPALPTADLAPMRLDSVQMLRAVAAIAVFTHHIRMLANGAWGVDLFFVISGFIMCYVTARSGRDFVVKRLIRVVPLYWAGTIAVFIVALAMPRLLNNTTANLLELAKSLAFIPFRKGTETTPVLFLGWTLNYEMFFYLIFTLSMAVSHRHRAVVASALVVGIVVLGNVVSIESVPLRFFSKPILLEFAYGMLCYAILMRPMAAPPRSAAARAPWILVGVLALACLPFATSWDVTGDRPVRWGILAALAFCCIVHGLYGVKLPKGVVLIGDASFSLYLFHPYVIQIFTKLGAFNGDGLRSYVMAAVTLAVCIGLSVLSFRHLERPISDTLRRLFLERPTRPAAGP